MQLQACLRCDLKPPLVELRHIEGCWICDKCYEYIQKEYKNDLAKEYNLLEEKCKGCD